MFIVIISIFCIFLYYQKRVFKQCNKCESNKIYIRKKQKFFSEFDKSIIFSNMKNINNVKFLTISQGNKTMLKDLFPLKYDFFKKKLLSIVRENLNINKVFIGEPFLRMYSNENYSISWHYDGNYTNGKKYTFVFLIESNSCNTSKFQYRDRKTEQVHSIDMYNDDLIYYEGDTTFHRVTKQKEDCFRLVLVCPVYTDDTLSWSGYFEKNDVETFYKT